jgi:TRAP-type C4-dicarboxylate transport system substrate-binding protein
LTECPVVVNKGFWDSLKPEHQKLFREAADIQVAVNRDKNAENRVQALEKVKAQGVEVVILTDEEKEAFKCAVQPVHDKYREIFGPEWYDFFVKKIADYSANQ